jgi:hypothetical protein
MNKRFWLVREWGEEIGERTEDHPDNTCRQAVQMSIGKCLEWVASELQRPKFKNTFLNI